MKTRSENPYTPLDQPTIEKPRLDTTETPKPNLTSLPPGPISTIFQYILFSNEADTRLAGQAGLLIRDLREGFSEAVAISDVHAYLALVDDSKRLTHETNPRHLRARFENQALPLSHDNKSIQKLAKLVDIKRRVLDAYQFSQLPTLGAPYDNNLELAILGAGDSFDEATLNLTTARLNNDEFFNTRLLHHGTDCALIADRLIDFVGSSASRFLNTTFPQCDDLKLIEFAFDPSFHKHEEAKLKVIGKLENQTLGQNSVLEFKHFWKSAINLIPSLGEPALRFVLDKCGNVGNKQLAFHAVKDTIDPQIATQCQGIVADRLRSGAFHAGSDHHTVVNHLARTTLFQQSAATFLSRQPANAARNVRAVAQDHNEINEIMAFIADCNRLDSRSEAVRTAEPPWHQLIMQPPGE